MPKQGPNIRSIAQKAGVAPSTVSRVLNGNTAISENTREKVLAVIEKEKYRKNALAMGVFGQKSGTIGLMFSTLGINRAEIVKGIHEGLMPHQCLPYLAVTDDMFEKEHQVLERFFERRVDGLIICPHHMGFLKHWRQFLEEKFPAVPIVFIDIMGKNQTGPMPIDYVGFDNQHDIAMAVDHLVGKGHRRIAYLGGLARMSSHTARKQGYLQGMKRHKLDAHTTVIQHGIEFSSGYKEIEELLSLPKAKRPTAIISATNVNMQSHYQGLLKAGITVGQDMDLAFHVSYDTHLEDLYPGTIRIRQHSFAMGKTACELLFSRLNDPQQTGQRILLKGQVEK